MDKIPTMICYPTIKKISFYAVKSSTFSATSISVKKQNKTKLGFSCNFPLKRGAAPLRFMNQVISIKTQEMFILRIQSMHFLVRVSFILT